RRELHLHAALELEAQDHQRVFELAYHFDAAGENKRALRYALAAAEQAKTQHALESALEQYRIAERATGAGDRAVRSRVAEGLGDVLMLAGHYDEAIRKFAEAEDLAEGDFAQAQIEGKVGELAFKRGDMKTAIEHLERALQLLGKRPPRWSVTFFF